MANTPLDYSAVIAAESIQDVTLSDFFTAISAIATAGEGVALVKGVQALTTNLAGKLATNAGFARIGNSRANAMFRDVAKQLKMKPEQVIEFRAYIEEFKGMAGRGGKDNFGFQKLKELGKEFLDFYGK